MNRAACLCLALLCFGCASEKPAETAHFPSDPKRVMPGLEASIFELAKAERQRLAPNSPPLGLDSELTFAAREKSADMAAHSYLAHVSPDGRTTAMTIIETDATFEGVLGENLAAQPYLPRYGVQVERFAQQIVQIWLASPKHRDNLVDAAYTRTGVGAAVNGNTVYVTELFAGKLASTGQLYAKPASARGRP